ncbi:MAG: Asp23/Gls24 family envelope stress response protein [Clostridia bacterium]
MEGRPGGQPGGQPGGGGIHIATDVVQTIAGLAATEVSGVAGMAGGIVGGIAEMLGRKNLAKGVKVDIEDGIAVVDLFIAVEFGSRIPDVAYSVQQRVRQTVESMTGLSVREVNIHVQGVAFPAERDSEPGARP